MKNNICQKLKNKEDKRKLVISSFMGNSYVVSVFAKERHSMN